MSRVRRNPYSAFQHDIDRIIRRRVNSSTDALYDALVEEIVRAASAAGNQRSVVVYVDRAIQFLFARGRGKLAAALAQDIQRISTEAALEGLRRSQQTFERFDREIPRVLRDEATLASRVQMRAKAEAEEMRSNFVPTLVGAIATAVHLSLKKSEQQQIPRDDAVKAAADAIRSQRYIAERAATWHASHAFNAAQGDIFEEVWPHVPDLMKRWTEHVDDYTRRPLDKHTAPDSIIMHGQVAFPTDQFVMPPLENSPTSLAGKSWKHPPNRPHDRAVLVPWRPSWGILAWIWRDGKKLTMKVGVPHRLRGGR